MSGAKAIIYDKYIRRFENFRCEGPIHLGQYLYGIIQHPGFVYEETDVPSGDGVYHFLLAKNKKGDKIAKFIERLDDSIQMVGPKIYLLGKYGNYRLLAQGILVLDNNTLRFKINGEFNPNRVHIRLVGEFLRDLFPTETILYNKDPSIYATGYMLPGYEYVASDKSVYKVRFSKYSKRHFNRIIWTVNNINRRTTFNVRLSRGSRTLKYTQDDVELVNHWIGVLGVDYANSTPNVIIDRPLKSYFLLENTSITVNGEEISIGKVLGESNNIVYECDNNRVLKVIQLGMPFTERIDEEQLVLEDYFYKKQKPTSDGVLLFDIPNHVAIGYLLPYMGKTITDLTLDLRQKLFLMFKYQYLTRFMEFVDQNKDYISLYNDVKPENTTYEIDDQGDYQFYLIDIDTNARTDAYYGDKYKTLRNQLFGILIVFHWFKTDESPFLSSRYSFKYKEQWARQNIDADLVDDMDVVLDMSKSNEDLYNHFIEPALGF
jgi:hypothetical protein